MGAERSRTITTSAAVEVAKDVMASAMLVEAGGAVDGRTTLSVATYNPMLVHLKSSALGSVGLE